MHIGGQLIFCDMLHCVGISMPRCDLLVRLEANTIEEAEQPMEQAGLRKSFSTADHIHTLEILIEKYQEKQRALYIAYIDYKNTKIPFHMYALIEQGVAKEYIKILKSIYRNNTGRVKLVKVGPSFLIKRCMKRRPGIPYAVNCHPRVDNKITILGNKRPEILGGGLHLRRGSCSRK
ncbi:unnamed protein product [Pieris macdunnoughi]|uniref:Uncharacterized protein n=1 Tax=Pieris macdunnoughi TaxID=345717 RepID=A0A821VF37_9NEOP|nr:unnamed protein product [Pieris macdunnoughi]